ncbi:MAG: hypothetical protein MK077_07845 [Phycisphaerales bacterium]|nr:hypothetical protein [Phycisphaerales bacterium]
MTRFATILTAVIVTAVLAMTSSVFGQGISSLPSIMKPEYFSRDLLLFIEGLDLTDEQQVISEIIFEDYERDFNAGLEDMEDAVTVVAETIDTANSDQDTIVEAVLAPIQDWSIRRDVLGRELVENIRVILDPDQQRAWTAFYRRLQREKLLPQGILSGESTNIHHVLRDLSLEPQPGSQLETAVQEWEVVLDTRLTERFEAHAGGFDLIEKIKSQSGGLTNIEDERRQLKSRIAVRDSIDESIEQLSPLMGDNAGRFRKEALKRGYGRIYRRTPVERLFDAALNTACVQDSPEIATSAAEIQADYLLALAAMNEELLVTTRDWEPRRERNRIENKNRRIKGEALVRLDDPTREMYQQRGELGRKYADILRDLLGQECFGTIDGAARFMPRPTGPPRGDRTEGPGGGIRASGTVQKPDKRIKDKQTPPSRPSGLGAPSQPGPGAGRGGDD